MLRTEPPDAVIDALRGSALIGRGDRVLIALSGGPDSTALLLAAAECGLDLVAAHYDHALREGSELVALQVGELCSRLGVELLTERRAAPMPKGSVQAGARALRYEFLDRARAACNARHVALAHTADDLVEGVVLHLLRGCGLAGLRGMPARRGHYIRPMLGVWRSEVSDWLRRRQIVTHDDPANADLRYDRVRVRMQILPALELGRPGITRRFHGAALRAAAVYEAAAAQAAAVLEAGPTDADLRAMSEPQAVEVLKAMYARAGGSEPGLSRSHLAAMLRLAEGGRGGRGVDLPGAKRFRIVDHVPEITSPGASQRPTRARLEISSCAGCHHPQAAHLRAGLELSLGWRRPGLRMRPAGGRGSRKLQDIFVDAHVPREERDGWPLVFAGERLVWVPGIAVDVDHLSRPGDPAEHVTITQMLAGPSKLVG